MLQDKKIDKRDNFLEIFVKEIQGTIIAAKENNFITANNHQDNIKQ